MKINKGSFVSVSAVALVLAMALCFPQIVLAAEANGGLDQAMQAFIQAMRSRNSQLVLAAFSRTSPWRYVQCDPVNGSPVHKETVTYTQMARDFKARKGWYKFLLVDQNYGCPIIQDFRPGMKWHRQGTIFVRQPDNPTALYLKWRQEGNKWVIAEIGQTGS